MEIWTNNIIQSNYSGIAPGHSYGIINFFYQNFLHKNVRFIDMYEDIFKPQTKLLSRCWPTNAISLVWTKLDNLLSIDGVSIRESIFL